MTHEERVVAIRSAFAEANDRMIGRLDRLEPAVAIRTTDAGWTAAQIGWHTAKTTEFLAGALAGEIADMSIPVPDDFTEELASLQLPDKIKTFPFLEPPDEVSKEDALTKLRASADTFTDALGAATAERCASTCVKMPFGVFSIYEVGEFTCAHIHRHLAQIDRTVES